MTADGSEILRSPVERTVVEIPLFTTGEEHACQVVKLGFLNHQQYHLSKGLEGPPSSKTTVPGYVSKLISDIVVPHETKDVVTVQGK